MDAEDARQASQAHDQQELARLEALQTAVAEVDPDSLTPREALEALYRLKAHL